VLSMQGLTKMYGRQRGICDLTLRVGRGEIFGFIGPNGAGKSTTIKMIVGLLAPDSGTVSVAGHDTATDPLGAKRRIGYVPDEPYVHPKLTARELLEMSCRLWSVAADEIDDRVARQLETFSLTDVADAMAGGYSHGMLQRLSLAAAMIHEPELLVLDEPMVGLDPRAARLVKDLLRRHSAQGGTVFLSTHVLEVAERLCSRIAIVSASRLVAAGTLDELRGPSGGCETLEDLFLSMTATSEQPGGSQG